jgi:hypothetical protein
MARKRSSHYRERKRTLPPVQLEDLNEIARKHSQDAQIEQARLELAERYEQEGLTPVEATDENAFNFMLTQAKTYIVLFGKKPLNPVREIEDMIDLLYHVQAEALSEEAQRHIMINELLEHGAHWLDVDAPSNVGAFVYPDWMETTRGIRLRRISALQSANNTWNNRKGVRRKSHKHKTQRE